MWCSSPIGNRARSGACSGGCSAAPPLGPGAPPAERLAAFYAAMVDLLERHVHLARGPRRGSAASPPAPPGFWRAHVHALLAASGEPAASSSAQNPLLSGQVAHPRAT
jgi:hypothetical protein